MFKALDSLIEAYRQEGTVPLRVGSRKVVRSHVMMKAPAAQGDIEQAERALGYHLPADYRQFLRQWNGGRLFVPNRGDPYPELYQAGALSGEQAVSGVDRLLVIGQLDDEFYLFLDGRDPSAEQWPVYCGEFVKPALKAPPVAPSFAEFLDRWVTQQGAWYWEEQEPVWVQESPVLWRHGLGLYLSRDEWPSPGIRIGLPQSPFAVTPAALRIAYGLREHLVGIGAQQVSPAALGRRAEGYWWFAFDQAAPLPLPEVDPRAVPPAQLGEDQWLQIEEGLWLHGAADVAYWMQTSIGWSGNVAGASYTLAWATGKGEAVAAPLKQRLDQIKAYAVHEPDRVPDGYEALHYGWSIPGHPVPEIRPVGSP